MILIRILDLLLLMTAAKMSLFIVHLRELKTSGLDFLREHQKVIYDLKEMKGKSIASHIRLLLP